MYPVTKAVADQFKTNAKQNLSLLVNPVVGESFELTSADILSAGLNINRYSATGDSVALGVCSAADLSLRVENGDGRFNDVVFEGAQIYASVGVEDGNNTQWVPLGYFTVDNAPRRLAVISITALDGMVQFDKLANRSALSLPNSVKNIVLACCNECNITIDTDLDALPNSDFVAQSVGDAEDLTYRTILQWCCQVMGVNGYMDWDGHLELSWYKKDGIPETVGGAVATFESVTEVPVSQLIVNVEPYQSFNGYDHPWVGGGNGNYLPNNATDGTTTLNGITLKEANGVYSLSGTASAETTLNISLSASVDLSPSTNKICFLNSQANSSISVGFTRGSTRIHYWSITPSNRVISGWTDTGNEVIDGIRIVIANGTAISGTLTISPMLVKTTDTSPTSFTPYSNICPIYPANGKNLLKNTASSNTVNGITFTVNADGTVTANGTASADAQLAVPIDTTSLYGDYCFIGLYDVQSDTIADAYIWDSTAGARCKQWDGSTAATNSIDGRLCQVKLVQNHDTKMTLRVRNGKTVNNLVFKPMLCHKETIGNTYVPYDSIGQMRTGKNLLKTCDYYNASLPVTRNADGSLKVYGSVSGNTSYAIGTIDLPAGTYTIGQGNGNTDIYFQVYDGLSVNVKGNTYNSDFSFTLTEQEVVMIRLFVRSGISHNRVVYPQVEFGETATSYEPYQSTQYFTDCTSAGSVYGGTLDVTTGVLTVTHALRNFDNYTGSINKSSNSNIKAGRCVYYINTTDTPWSGGDGNPRGIVMKCSIYDIGSKGYTEMVKKTEFAMGIGSYSGTYCMIGFNVDDSLSTVTEFRTWLQSAHCDVWYPLRNPQTYQLTPTQVELLKGTNNIWADNSTLSVTFPAVTEITPADRYNSDIFENAVTITGVSVKGKENQAVAGSEDYALAIDGNALITDDDVETIANGLSGLIGFSYHPFSASVLPMPYLYPLDMVAVQYKDEWYDCAITEINFTSTAPTQLKGTGESAQSRSYARINPLTNRERAIIENLKDEMNTTLNKAVNNIIDFNNIISNALGLYHTNVADGSGGFIRYLHDAPDLESSTYIVTETAQGFAWTTNGWNGGTPVWQYGVTSGGYALFKWLSAEGIDVTRASSDYRAEVTPEHFNIYYKNDLIITIDATGRAIQTPRMVIPYSSTSINSLRVGQLVWIPTQNGANAVVLGG